MTLVRVCEATANAIDAVKAAEKARNKAEEKLLVARASHEAASKAASNMQEEAMKAAAEAAAAGGVAPEGGRDPGILASAAAAAKSEASMTERKVSACLKVADDARKALKDAEEAAEAVGKAIVAGGNGSADSSSSSSSSTSSSDSKDDSAKKKPTINLGAYGFLAEPDHYWARDPLDVSGARQRFMKRVLFLGKIRSAVASAARAAALERGWGATKEDVELLRLEARLKRDDALSSAYDAGARAKGAAFVCCLRFRVYFTFALELHFSLTTLLNI